MNERYVLLYQDGTFVRRDDSTGPMSTGGYPEPVDDLKDATFFPTPQAAAQYAEVSGWRGMARRVYHVEYSLGAFIEYSKTWVECNHNCTSTYESTASEAKHFLDCPVWTKSLENMKRLV